MKAVRPRKYYDFEREMREKVSPEKVRDEVSTQLLCGENVPGTTVSLDRERENERALYTTRYAMTVQCS